MSLVKTSFLNGIAVMVKAVSLFVLNKVLAVYAGPSGYAVIGQLQNALTMITTLSIGAVNTGVTKYTAEYAGDQQRQAKVWQSATSLALLSSVVIAILVALFSPYLARYFLHDEGLYGVFIAVALSLSFFTLHALMLAILNGRKEVGRYVIASISASLVSLGLTSFLAFKYGLVGALLSIGVGQGAIFFTTVAVCLRAPWFKLHLLFGRWQGTIVLNLLKYAAMAVTGAVCLPVAQVLIRKHLIHQFGIDAAGYWEAMWRLSSAYLIIVTMTLSVYYVPRLSELEGVRAIFSEIRSGYVLILPVAMLCALVIYILRDFVIGLLFTSEFMPMRELFAWQLLGDVLKLGAWLVASVMLGKAMFKLFIVSEVVFAALFYGLTVWFTGSDGLLGVAKAYALNSLIYWIFMLVSVAVVLRTSYRPLSADGSA